MTGKERKSKAQGRRLLLESYGVSSKDSIRLWRRMRSELQLATFCDRRFRHPEWIISPRLSVTVSETYREDAGWNSRFVEGP
jgi:hypothetical protein